MDSMVHEMSATELQRTLYDISLGMQAAQGYVGGIQLSSALERYGFDDDCKTCWYRLGMAEGALMERGNIEENACYAGYFSIR